MCSQLSARQTITKHTEKQANTEKDTFTSSAQMEKAIEMLMDTDEDTHTQTVHKCTKDQCWVMSDAAAAVWKSIVATNLPFGSSAR